MADNNLLHTLQSYVPDPITRRIAAGLTIPAAPHSVTWPAAVLLVDISGFTPLTEKLAARGPLGAEELSRLLDIYFDQMIYLVYAHGGQIVQQVGDSLIVAWPAEEEQLAGAAQRALQCAAALKAELNGYEVKPGTYLYLKIIAGAGPVIASSVGGRQNQWKYLMAGAPLRQISAAEKWAAPGDIIASPEMWAVAQNFARGELLAGGAARVQFVQTIRPSPLPPVHLPPEAEPVLRQHISRFIQNNLTQNKYGWLAELRRLTILFLNLQIDYEAANALEQLQRAVNATQKVLYRYEGNWTRLVVDEKGTSLLLVFGLPPYTHEDDPRRAVQMALALDAVLAPMGLTATVGITTGRVFCGNQGNARRREYTFLGDVVNLAARLMKAAVPSSQRPGVTILCDETTYQATRSEIRYKTLPPMQLKGKSQPAAVFQPISPAQFPLTERRTARAAWPLIGREEEMAQLREHIARLQKENRNGLVLIAGEAGIGKSHLANAAMAEAKQQGIASLFSAANAMEKFSPYHVWRPLFSRLLQLDIPNEGRVDAALVAEQLQTRFAAAPELWPLLPLLNPVLPVELPDTAVTAQMNLENRADNTRDLMVTILQQTIRPGAPHALLLEDVHWMDAASWQLLLMVAEQVRPLLIILTARRLALQKTVATLPKKVQQMLNGPSVHTISLGPLDKKYSLKLVCQRLGVDALPDTAARLILEKTEGHPFFSEEMAYAMRDNGYLRIENGRCYLAPTAAELRTIEFPDTIEGVVTSRIARLSPAQQLTVKIASVIGRIFILDTLRHIYPIPEEKENVPQYADDLARLDITPYYKVEPDISFIFRHILSREVAYNLMLFSQRKQIHQAVAEWYEQTYAGDLSAHYPLLAYHWLEAARLEQDDPHVTSKAITFLDKAGGQALRNGAMREASQFYGNLLALLAELPPHTLPRREITPRQIARWNRKMGQALLKSGQAIDARAYLEEALRLLGFPVPAASSWLGIRILGQYGRQALHRFLPQKFMAARAADSERLLEAAAVYDFLVEAHFIANETAASMYYAIARLNTAELARPSDHLGAYAGICMTMSLLTLARLAEMYGRLALAAASQMDDLATRGLTILRVNVHYVGYCQWETARKLAAETDAICARLNDWQLWATNTVLEASIAQYTGQFAEARRIARRGAAYAQRSGNRVHQEWALRDMATASAALGELEEAAAYWEELLEISAVYPSEGAEISAYGSLAMVYWQQGKITLAQETAATGWERIQKTRPIVYSTLGGYRGVAELYLRLWESGACPAEELRPKAIQAVKAYKTFARSFPIGRPGLALVQGLAAWLSGKEKKACKIWRQGIDTAEKLGMPYEKGQLLAEYGRHLPPSDPRRQAALTEATQIFQQLGAQYDLKMMTLLQKPQR